MTTFIVVLTLLTVGAIVGILWLAGRWEQGRPTNEAIGVPSDVLRQLDEERGR